MVDSIANRAPRGSTEDYKKTRKRLWEGNSHLEENRDFDVVKIYCDLLQEYGTVFSLVKSTKIKAASSRVHTNSNGTIQTHPLVSQLREIRTEVRSYQRALGLSPEDASRLKLTDSNKVEKIKEITQTKSREDLLKGE